MVWSKTLAFPMLCCFASPLTNTVHVGPKRKPKVRNGTTGLAISALLLLATAFSAASSSLSASLMACLMSSITRMPAANCWCGRRWSDCGGRSYRTTDTHPPCSLSPAVSGQAGLDFSTQFVKCISQLYFCVSAQTQTHTHTLASCLRAGMPGFFTLAQLSQVGSNLLWHKKNSVYSSLTCVFSCALWRGSKHKVSQRVSEQYFTLSLFFMSR